MTPPSPDAESPVGPWSGVGRLLPKELRERVFYPAYGDLLADHTRPRDARVSRVPFGIRVLATAVDSYRVGVPMTWWKMRRGLRRAFVFLAVATVVLLGIAKARDLYDRPPDNTPPGQY